MTHADPGHRIVSIAKLEANGVPLSRQLRVGPFGEARDNICDGDHTPIVGCGDMDLLAASAFQPEDEWVKVTTIESHTGGEPFRVVIDGVPDIPGRTVLEKRRYAQENLDSLRRQLMWEPRGHADMYGCFLGEPTESDSDLSVLFMHNEGFSTMCGHGIIALTKVLIETGAIPGEEPETTVRIDTPAGQVTATAQVADGKVSEVRFRNVPSYVVDLDNALEVPGVGRVEYDLAFGGGFYAYVAASSLGLRCVPADVTALVEAAGEIKESINETRSIEHPFEPDLAFLYGVIFTGDAEHAAHHSRNVAVFAEGEVDRSPTGTGVSGRLAIEHARGDLGVGETMTVESVLGSTFTGRIADVTEYGSHTAVIPEIEGEAHLLGSAKYWVDPNDSIGRGFLLR